MVAMKSVQMEMAVHTAKSVNWLDVLLMPDNHAHTDHIGQKEVRNVSLESNRHICNPFRKKPLPGRPIKRVWDGNFIVPLVCTDKEEEEKDQGGCAAFTHHAESKHRGSSPFCSEDSIQDYRHPLLGISWRSDSNSLVHKLLLLRKYKEWISAFFI